MRVRRRCHAGVLGATVAVRLSPGAPRSRPAGGSLGHLPARCEPAATRQVLEEAAPRPAGPLARLIDVVLAALLLVVLAPLMLLVGTLVRVTSRGPAIFEQSRIGYRRQPFVMLKFRTMYANCDDSVHRDFVGRMLGGEDPRSSGPGGLFKLVGDCRITPLGRLLRATSLDELPQLVNVLRGEMSLVGPRPALAWELERYQPHHHERFLVKPGITGLWQVSGRSRLTINEALELDVEYARRRSVALDLWILVRTVGVVLRSGAA